MRKIILLISLLFPFIVNAQEVNIPLPKNLPQTHPRLLTGPDQKPVLQKLVENESWAKEVLDGIYKRIDPYVAKTQKQPDWLLSRLMMYWKSKATNVYINGGVYTRADGEAPVPTVRFGSTRGVSSPIKRPKLEDIIPYMDDTKGVYFHNTAKAGNPLEWVDQSNVSGMNIESVNNEILRLGRDGAFIYWLTGNEKYGKFAYDVFNTYMTGMYYRNRPYDLGNGHAHTLAGMSTFEVIQEAILPDLAAYYDFLYEYIRKKDLAKIAVFEETFKKWIDVTILDGVPHNNWNLHQANIILPVAMILEDSKSYADQKGREYYINHILNVSAPRQWAIPRLMKYGYDFETGVWNESPGYAHSVTKEFMHFIQNYDNTFNQNLLPYTPVMHKAVKVLPQYLFPNGMITAFGDSYYGELNTDAIKDMIRMAQKYSNKENEATYTAMYKLLNRNASAITQQAKPAVQVSSFFTQKPLQVKSNIEKAKLSDYVTPTFYAPNVSWLVQRNKYDSKESGLMISQYASYGNHAHSNGVAIELYGKGYILGPDLGIGSSYFEKPYLEFYSQFPAHNTVMVDGISKYPEMLSNHPFDLLAHYPVSGKKDGYYPDITYSSVYFLEPESRSDQNRFLSIVSTGETTGYYVDIFRSKKQRQGDKFHDYFYHNLGQQLWVKDANGNNLDLKPSEEMAFAGGHLFALDYMWDKRSAKTNGNYTATWKMAMPDSNHVYMNLWMKGYEGREVFTIKSPPVKSFRSNADFPYAVDKSPALTISARQHGEAWNHPFVSVYEPSTEKEGKSIESISSFEVQQASPDFVGLIVKSKSGRTDYIFSSVKDGAVQYRGMTVDGTYGVVSEVGKDFTLFLGNGQKISAKGFTIESAEKANVVLSCNNGEYYFTSDQPVLITTAKKRKVKMEPADYKLIKL
ncbi:hypothetical protein Pedsa_3761 [Pseudopedobacter saltans DSM 12145]|uniref:Heparinase II/III family protein n=1 Tax=Pseudopedobacter saltans (strain ATCC 51119 / DSM 12145 / JCM 21818 / CCUG 39354 / LMG 10337 / NBRC 100064 / NCIMB 13643) TaxID=762903 RepID=F0S6G4_PSESL|nr:hypothetical protein [Pseudopedobacter saltans]ADY54290.1 hypothetical protein Pedsa_3761 [Pseudopedobacter saltans DSM 12145]